jgi:hypothetical protein
MTQGWKDAARPAYFGAKRDMIFADYDSTYGKGNWRLAWRVGEVDVDFIGACALYEDAYFAFFKNRPLAFRRLLREARNVYDDSPSNVDSGFDYAKQETGRTHVQDIAIRRCVLRSGKWFKGTALIQIRDSEGSHPLSMELSPGQVPFHLLSLIEPYADDRRNAQWYKVGSVEDFYQRNRYLQIRT